MCSVSVPSCKALRSSALQITLDGEYVIHPAGIPVKVYCDMTTNGGRSEENMARGPHIKVTEMLVSPYRGLNVWFGAAKGVKTDIKTIRDINFLLQPVPHRGENKLEPQPQKVLW